MDTDRTWEHYGKEDPYFGVLTHERFRRANIDQSARDEFFESGELLIRHILEVCERHLGRELPRLKALDFGCGVARLSIPLAKRFAQVVGVDVSESMIAEARRVIEAQQISNIAFHRSLDELEGQQGTFSFVNSQIVLQHIEPARGLKYVAAMLQLLAPGGFGALHVTYARQKDSSAYGTRSLPSRAARVARHAVQGWIANVTGRPAKIQMNAYCLNKLIFMLQNGGVTALHSEFTSHGGHLGIRLLFSR